MKRNFFSVAIVCLSSLPFTAQNLIKESQPLSLADFNGRACDEKKTVLVYFHASWCMVCAKMEPVIHRLDSVYGDKLEVLDVDTDRDKEVAEEFEIDALPVLMIYSKGQRQWIHVGIMGEKDLSYELEPYVSTPGRKSKK